MNFNLMTVSQLAAFWIGVSVSILAIAGIITAFRFADKFKSKIAAISLALIMPFIALIAWFFLIFSFMEGLKSDELLNLILSIVLSAMLVFVVAIVARALYIRYNNLKEEKTKVNKEPTTDVQPVAPLEIENKTEEIVIEEQTLESVEACASLSQNKNSLEVNSPEEASEAEILQISENVETEEIENNVNEPMTEEEKELNSENLSQNQESNEEKPLVDLEEIEKDKLLSTEEELEKRENEEIDEFVNELLKLREGKKEEE